MLRWTGILMGLIFLCNVLPPNIGRAENEPSPGPTPTEVFNQRILPIFRSPKPSSCVQCHLAAVDLKNYILPSHEKTFVSLRDQGLIDLAAPEKSKILTLIRMGDKDLDPGARLIHKKIRQKEYEAFANWIEACCADSRLRNLPALNPKEQAKPEKPDAVIRHARKSRVVDSFARNIWSQRMRCFPCHTPHEIDPSNPRHKAALKTRKKLEQDYGSEGLARLDLFQKSPEATLNFLLNASRETPNGQLPIINLKNPLKSLLLLKPTSKLPTKKADGSFENPSSSEPVSHLGGLKMHPDDQSYKSFAAWLQDYAKVVGNEYTSVEDLPADNWQATQLVLRLNSLPEDWSVGVPVQLFLHAWDARKKTWEPKPMAFTQGTVTPRGMVNGALFLLTPRKGQTDGKELTTLERGEYLVKVYVDLKGRLAQDPALLLGEDDFQGQTVLNNSRWREGFRQAKQISGTSLKKQ